MKIRYDICTANGCLVTGGNHDFLSAILQAKEGKASLQRQLPHSRFRVQMFYPNGQRIPSIELKAALRALSDKTVLSMVSNRLAAAALRSGVAVVKCGSAVAVGCDFSQAGVVAPPDSPDLGNSLVSSIDRSGV